MARLSPANPAKHAPRQLMRWDAFVDLAGVTASESRLLRQSPLLQRSNSGMLDSATARAVLEGIRLAQREAGIR